MKNTYKLTEGAILLAAFAVLMLVSIYVPVVGGFFNFVLPAPFILFSAKNSWKYIGAFYIAALFISFITGSVMGLGFMFTFGTVGVIIGYLVQKEKSRTVMLITSTLVLLVGFVVIYAVSAAFMNINFIHDLNVALNEAIKNAEDIFKQMGREDQIVQLKSQIDMVKTLIPSALIIASVLMAFTIQWICFPIAKRFGLKVQPWGNLKNLTLPKSLLWYYLIAQGINIFIRPEQGAYLSMVILNAVYLLEMFLVLQGVALIFYFIYKKSVPKVVGVILAFLAFMIPIFHYIIMLLGIVDIGFDYRKRFEKKE